MSDRSGLPHLAYFKALAKETSEHNSIWRSTLAGLVAVRLVDAWADGVPLPAAGLRALERAINMMDVDAPERAPLRQLYEGLLAESAGRRTHGEPVVLTKIRLYVDALWHAAEWHLAIDVCRTAIEHAMTPAERATTPALYDRLGNCLRAIGEADKALQAFETGRAMCAYSDVESDLYLRISEANLEEQRGNSAVAERLLDEVLVDAAGGALPNVLARANHDRGAIAYHRDDDRAALSYYFIALGLYDSDVGRDRVLADIALVIFELGLRDDARDAFRKLETHSVEPVQRWTATINLMRIATLDGDERCFSECREKLCAVRLSARLRAHYELSIAEGCLRFDQLGSARRAWHRAQEVVQRHRIHELDQRLAKAQDELVEQGTKKREPLALHRAVTRTAAPNDLQPFVARTIAAMAALATRQIPVRSHYRLGAETAS